MTKNSYSLSSGTNEFFVNQLYDKFLNRVADGSGKLFWETALGQGVSRDTVILDFVKSSEYSSASSDVTSYVSSLYKNLLNRPADAEGIAYWTDSLKNGVSKTTIAQAFLNSSEFYNLTDFGSAGLLFSRDAAGNQVVSPTEVFKEIEGDAHTSHQFYVQLTNAPTKDVKLYLETSDLHAGKLQLAGEQSEASRIELNFTPNNWATAQAFNVLAKDDGFAHQDQSWKVFALTNSQDAVYDYFRPNKTGEAISVWATNTDQAGVSIHKLDFDLLSKGQSGNVGLVLTSKPTADVYLYVRGLGGHFNINGSPAFDEQVFKFTPQNWNIEQKAILQHADVLFNADSKSDSIVVDIRSSDSLYNSLADKTYALPIIDRGQSSNPLNSIDVNSGSGSQGSAIFAQTTNANSVVDDAIASILKNIGSFIGQDIESARIPFLGDLKGKTTNFVTFLETSINKVIANPNSVFDGDQFTYDFSTKNFTLKLNDTIPLFDASLTKDLGIDGLKFYLDGNINTKIGYDLTVKGGWNTTDGAFVDRAGTKFSSNIDLSGDNLQVKGLLGPLSIVANDKISPNSAKSRDDTGAAIKIDLNLKNDTDGKLTIDEAKSIVTGKTELKDAIDLSVSGNAQLSLGVKTQAALPAEFNGATTKYLPTYTFDLTAPLSFNYNPFDKNTNGSPSSAEFGSIYFDNVQLQIPDFINNDIKPIVEQVNKAIKPLYPYVNYMLQGEPVWNVSETGKKFATDVAEPMRKIPVIGENIGNVLYKSLAGLSDIVNNAYQEAFKQFDGLSSYNQTTPYIKDNLISPLELLRSASNLYYNLAFDGKNTVDKILNSTEVSMKASEIPQLVIDSTKTALKTILEKYNGDKSAQDTSSQIKSAVDSLEHSLVLIQKFEKLSTSVQNFQADGVINFDNFIINGPDAPSQSQSLTNSMNMTLESSSTTGSNTAFESIINDLKELGFTFPVLEQANGDVTKTKGKFLKALFSGEVADIVTFTPDLKPITFPELKLPFGVIEAFGIPKAVTDTLGVNLDLVFSNQASFETNLSFGLDTFGANSWVINGFQNKDLYKWLDGFYIKDSAKSEFKLGLDTKIAVEGGINTPAFKVYDLGVEKGLLNANTSIYVRADSAIGLDIKDTGEVSGQSDGKVRPSELLQYAKNVELPFDISAAIDLYAGLTFKGRFDATKLPGWDKAQEWISFDVGDGKPNEFKILSIGDSLLLST